MLKHIAKIQDISCVSVAHDLPKEVVAIMHDRVVVIAEGEAGVDSTLFVEVVDELCKSFYS